MSVRTIEGNTLTIRIGAEHGNVTVSSLLHVLKDTLVILRDIDSRISQSGHATLRWEVINASLNSPLTLTITGTPVADEAYNPNVASTYVDGVRRLERGAETPPHFSVKSIQMAKRLIGNGQNGSAPLVIATPGRDPVEPTPQLAKNVEVILKRTFYTAETTLEGRLEALDLHGKLTFAIYDTLTGHETKCYFDKGMLEQIISALLHRVAVAGVARYNRRTGLPVSIRATSLRKLRSSEGPPQLKGADKIDITGGIDSAKYIRSIRDAE